MFLMLILDKTHDFRNWLLLNIGVELKDMIRICNAFFCPRVKIKCFFVVVSYNIRIIPDWGEVK